MAPEPRRLLVAGDFILDRHIYEGRRLDYGDRQSRGVIVKEEMGGAMLVHGLLRELLPSPAWRVDPESAPPCSDPSQHSHAYWRPYPLHRPQADQHWRVSEAMGFGDLLRPGTCPPVPPLPRGARQPDVIAISDGGMGFRDHEPCWRPLPFSGARWILLKTTDPLAQGPLWRLLERRHRERLVVVVSASAIRHSPVRIPAALSWEEAVEGIARELGTGGPLAQLARCRHLVVTFGTEGALWIESGRSAAGPRRSCLVFEAGAIEGDHARATPGRSFGLLSCMAAAVARQLASDRGPPDLARGMESGLSAMRDLLERGHGPAAAPPDGFPVARLAEVIRRPRCRYSRADLELGRTGRSGSPGPVLGEPGWTLLREVRRPAFAMARLVARRGRVALRNVPHVEIGRLISVDRREVESFRALSQVVHGYVEGRQAGRKPLSIGVFGPPGAGKSFAVQQICAGLDRARRFGWMEFNLSQFSGPEDLIGAFHQVRDRVLQGQIPVAFFDEFDSQSYRWLKHLLAPMQDGRFQEGRLTHTLGDAIFVFAGGTSWTYAAFGPPRGGGRRGESEEEREFRLAKGPDFKSRLDAYLDVVGPNRRSIPAKRPGRGIAVGGHRLDDDPEDFDFPLRRALLIRAALRCEPDQKLEIDEGLLNGLLHVARYSHGARSLSKILECLAGSLPGPIYPSQLPPAVRLAMHTEARAFLKECERRAPEEGDAPPLPAASIPNLARAVHEVYRRLGRQEGWLDRRLDRPLASLPPYLQESNRAAARRLPAILAVAGLHLRRGAWPLAEERAIRRHIEFHLELMAEEEHARWMDWHLERGWVHGRVKDSGARPPTHPDLLPFAALDNAQRDKDRNAVRHYPDFARMAGMRIDFPRE